MKIYDESFEQVGLIKAEYHRYSKSIYRIIGPIRQMMTGGPSWNLH